MTQTLFQVTKTLQISLNSLLVTFYKPAREIWFQLLALSVGSVIYQLITNKLHRDSST